MSVSSQDQSSQLFSCKWAWCRSTFSNNAGLVHHVVHDHVHRAIPVRRRDIPMIRRAEEGKGESLKISELMVDIYSYSTISHKSVEPPQEPSSSLPSPPASSPALHSPGLAPSPRSPSLEHRKKIKPRSPDHLSCQTLSPLPSSNQITSFASLSSPESERAPFSFEIPDSPLFSSLVERPNKRKITSNIADSKSRNKTHANEPHPFSLSQPPSSLFDSQKSVEVQLTQTEQDDDDIDQDEDLDLRHHSQTPGIPFPSSGLIRKRNGCKEELQWEPSQPAEEYLTSDPISQSQSIGHHHLENLPVTSQPPSQLRLDSEFPFHFHDRPRGSISEVPQTVLDPSAAMPVNPSSPASSPTFAVSTPVKQNWYQPPLKRRKQSDKKSEPSPLKAGASVSPTKSKKMFRSGTLQIMPASLSEESKAKHATVDALPMDIDSTASRQNNLATPDSPCDLDIFSQFSQDSSDLFESISYPALQTQAPYQSQSLTQF
ncbi:hypothetical protein BYT27DRAFT_7207677 [Phlegmacium glaucopus]|nr:hypothetical protein BYT27DRAFT_7207677 [Phlegmacium glaucopus]